MGFDSAGRPKSQRPAAFRAGLQVKLPVNECQIAGFDFDKNQIAGQNAQTIAFR
jgi:hypothetical protein